jgi:hypothetical protein
LISDKRYFARRALEEASRAARSLSPTARAWHQELSEKFSALARDACIGSADERARRDRLPVVAEQEQRLVCTISVVRRWAVLAP